MRKNFILSSFIVSSLLVISCSKSDGGSAAGGGSGGTGGGGSPTPGPLFIAVRGVLQTNCAVSGCHANPSPQNGINFADDNTIVAQKDRIKVRAVDQAGTANQMPQPPRAALSAADQKKITDWITAGGLITN